MIVELGERIGDLEQVSVFGGRRSGAERRPSLLSHIQGFNCDCQPLEENTKV